VPGVHFRCIFSKAFKFNITFFTLKISTKFSFIYKKGPRRKVLNTPLKKLDFPTTLELSNVHYKQNPTCKGILSLNKLTG